ncbi:DUF6798 domain-containing protein [Roseovarius phycicola]|uniref:DUF6798 domain-containing protein n=1 Tax=Roseovarius phycicola TaxID=3080976 RepID=A0ABZ2HDZ1_9RHOB
MHLDKILFAVTLGLLAHAFIGYFPYPYGDDFAYAPLADYRADPTLFARDEQLQLFANHAKAYNWVHALGTATFGVEPVFRIAIWMLAAGVAIALYALLAALGAPFFVLPAVLGLGVVVQIDGMGRADFGGLISHFFHHHNVALALSLAAIAAAFWRRPWLAGVLLGLAVFGQPMTAFHGAIVAGLGALLRHPPDAFKMAVAAMIAALPAALPILPSILSGPEGEITIDLIQDAYRFRTPHHYDPSWFSVGLATLYLLAGLAGTVHFWYEDRALARCALGAMIGFAILHLVTIIVYKLQVSQWVGFYILDANRSSSLLFALGPALALAGMWRAPNPPLLWISGTVLIVALTLNATIGGLLFLVLTVLMWRLADSVRLRSVLAIALVTALVVLFPAKPFPPAVPEPTRVALERIKQETPRDALFIIPIGMMEFRLLAQRSAYVDFKLFSVAQPDQATLTRERIDDVGQLSPENQGLEGWPAAIQFGEEQRLAATCDGMVRLLTDVEADYFVRYVAPGETPPVCADLANSISSETVAVYGPLR